MARITNPKLPRFIKLDAHYPRVTSNKNSTLITRSAEADTDTFVNKSSNRAPLFYIGEIVQSRLDENAI